MRDGVSFVNHFVTTNKSRFANLWIDPYLVGWAIRQ